MILSYCITWARAQAEQSLHKTAMFVSASVWTELVFRKRKKKSHEILGNEQFKELGLGLGKADLTYNGGGGVEGLQLDAAEAH